MAILKKLLVELYANYWFRDSPANALTGSGGGGVMRKAERGRSPTGQRQQAQPQRPDREPEAAGERARESQSSARTASRILGQKSEELAPPRCGGKWHSLTEGNPRIRETAWKPAIGSTPKLKYLEEWRASPTWEGPAVWKTKPQT